MRLPSFTPTPCPMGRGYTVNEGWITYEAPDGSGVIVIDSVEIDESMYPIVIESRRLATDTLGAGQWNGAPATEGSYQSLSRDMRLFIAQTATRILLRSCSAAFRAHRRVSSVAPPPRAEVPR